MASRRTVGGRSRGGVIVACLVLLSAGLVTAWTPVAAASDRGRPATDEGIAIDDDLPEGGTDVEVIVRLEDAPAAKADVDPDDVDPDRLEDHAAETQEPLLESAADAPGITVVEEFWVTNAVVLEVNLERVDLEAFERFEAVEAVHRNVEVPVPEPPAERPDWGNASASTSTTTDGAARTAAGGSTTAGIDAIGAPSVWEEYDTQGEGVRVAVLDTGIDVSHPGLELYTEDPADPTYPGGWAEFDETGQRVPGSTPHDTGVHGTHVSGTVAGGDAARTAVGVAPEAELMHGLVLGETSGTFAQIVAGMEWALAEDADVINMSLGTTGTHPYLIEPVRNANRSGAIVVGAVGNEGAGTSGSPANVYEALSVGAVNADGDLPPFSGGERLNRTDWAAAPPDWPASYTVPDVVAPGVAIESTAPGGGYARLPGTSMASPHVAGTAALLLSIEPDATPAELSSVLTDTARLPADVPESEAELRYGHGIVDAGAAADALAASGNEGSLSSGSGTGNGDGSDAHVDSTSDRTASATDADWQRYLVPIGLAALLGALVLVLASRTSRLER